jgi:hypothetical protein
MSQILTVPNNNTALPPQPTVPSPLQSSETDPTVTDKAKKVAKAKLKQKNRKANEFVLNMPLNLAFEAASVYKLSGFTPDANAGTWVVTDVNHTFKGKTGSTTKVTLRRTLNDYKQP